MLLLSYRSDELHRRHPLRPLLAELDRLDRARRIAIPAFDRSELAEALADILGKEPGEQLVDRLFARSEGNALYTEELLAAGLDGRGATPRSLRDAFILRIERMSEDAQRAARAIAVGRALDELTVGELTGIDHEALHTALRQAVSERALELWPRVPGAADALPLDHVELLALAARAHAISGDRARGEILLRSALGELDPAADPHRYSSLLTRLARIQWALNRGNEGVETAQRALAMLPAGEASTERASLLGWLARTRHLRGRFREALSDGEAALAIAVAAGDSYTEGEVLNTLGMAHIAVGQVDEGVGQLRRALEIARENDDPDAASHAYSNLADLLNLAGRTADALQIAKEGLAMVPRRVGRGHDWMTLTVSELSFEVGDWDAARADLGPPPSQLGGLALILRLLR